MQAIWNDTVIAESNDTIVIEGNHYFPAESVKNVYLQNSKTTSFCGWKGTANYYSLSINGQLNIDAAWYYASPKQAAAEIAGYIAFWKGVLVTA
ncbi:MAG: DUF427 domain-containing protein [Arenicella sp.]